MYDSWWPERDNRGLSSIGDARKGRVNYYVATTATMAEKATFVRSEPLTEAETSLRRPDLPLAALQCPGLSWPAEAPESAEELARSWSSADCPETEVLGASEVYLFPFGPKGGGQAGVRVKADNGTSFRWDELVWKACVVQAPFVRAGASAQGIGICRSGLTLIPVAHQPGMDALAAYPVPFGDLGHRNPGQHFQHRQVSLPGHAQLPQHEQECQASSGVDVSSIRRDST
jgi:hypothetical protein